MQFRKESSEKLIEVNRREISRDLQIMKIRFSSDFRLIGARVMNLLSLLLTAQSNVKRNLAILSFNFLSIIHSSFEHSQAFLMVEQNFGYGFIIDFLNLNIKGSQKLSLMNIPFQHLHISMIFFIRIWLVLSCQHTTRQTKRFFLIAGVGISARKNITQLPLSGKNHEILSKEGYILEFGNPIADIPPFLCDRRRILRHRTIIRGFQQFNPARAFLGFQFNSQRRSLQNRL